MNKDTLRHSIAGPAGALECAIDEPTAPARGLAVVCHPHPLHGGTLDNKVVQTLARAALARGWRCVRFNFRGVGASAGTWDEGRGEVQDALAVVAHHRQAADATSLPLALAGFSFGGYVAARAAAALAEAGQPVQALALVAPAASRFELGTVPPGTWVLHGEADEVVPLSATLDWARPQNIPVLVLPGTGHFFHGQLALLKDMLLRGWPDITP